MCSLGCRERQITLDMIVYRFAFNHGFTVTDFLGFCVTQWSAIMFYCGLFTAAPSPQKKSKG